MRWIRTDAKSTAHCPDWDIVLEGESMKRTKSEKMGWIHSVTQSALAICQ